jgi:hypothetical protein
MNLTYGITWTPRGLGRQLNWKRQCFPPEQESELVMGISLGAVVLKHFFSYWDSKCLMSSCSMLMSHTSTYFNLDIKWGVILLHKGFFFFFTIFKIFYIFTFQMLSWNFPIPSLRPAPLPTHSHFLVLAFPCTIFKENKTKMKPWILFSLAMINLL